MSAGFIYILENEAIPGLLKIGSTEKHPEERARELTSTGVPKPFKVVYHWHVFDYQMIEKQIHKVLESQGYRENTKREFFAISTDNAMRLIETIIIGSESVGGSENNIEPLSHEGYYTGYAYYQAIQLPLGIEQIDERRLEELYEKLTKAVRIGYFPALLTLAEIYKGERYNSNLFREYYREFFITARKASKVFDFYDNNIGHYLGEYIRHLEQRKCLKEPDFAFVQQYLVDGDQYTYNKFIDYANRLLDGVTKRRCLDL